MLIKILKIILILGMRSIKKGNLDAILSNTSGCGTTMKDYGFIFRDDKELSKKAKVISNFNKGYI